MKRKNRRNGAVVAITAGSGANLIASKITDMGKTAIIVRDRDSIPEHFTHAIITGGQDINPFLYGERNLYSDDPNVENDARDWFLIHQAMRDRRPLLGICRGCQMIAAAAGGSLWQDIHIQTASKIQHGYHNHLVTVAEPLAGHIGQRAIVNSLHHQAIRVIPWGYKEVATAHDGITEAIWRPGVLGVQWHPEHLSDLSIFRWLLAGLA